MSERHKPPSRSKLNYLWQRYQSGMTLSQLAEDYSPSALGCWFRAAGYVLRKPSERPASQIVRLKIIAAYRNGKRQSDIAREFGVSRQYVNQCVSVRVRSR